LDKNDILLAVFSPGSAEANAKWGGKLNSCLMANRVKNIYTENYQNLVIGFQVTVENVRDVFLRHNVYDSFEMSFVWTVWTVFVIAHAELTGGVQQSHDDEHRLPGSVASVPSAELRHVSRRRQLGRGRPAFDEMWRKTASLRAHAQSLGISVAVIIVSYRVFQKKREHCSNLAITSVNVHLF